MTSKLDREAGVLKDLEPAIVEQYERHMGVMDPWHPHDYVKWSDGEDFARFFSEEGGKDWDPSQSHLRPVAQKAFILNLLTEDKLPSYHYKLLLALDDGSQPSPKEGEEELNPWVKWVHQWTTEEDRHAAAMWAFMVTSRAADPAAHEDARMVHMAKSFHSTIENPYEAIAYVTPQELATQQSHNNTARILEQDGYPVGARMLRRVAGDESLHYALYQNLGKAMFEHDPNAMMQATAKQFIGFSMPGAGSIPNFKKDSREIAAAGIYNVPIHVGRVLKPIMRHWNVLNIDGLNAEGKEAQDLMGMYLAAAEVKAAEHADKYGHTSPEKQASDL